MAPPPYDLPLNGLVVSRGSLEGTVIESTISGKPTPQAPHVTSQYMVMWDDGRKEGGLSRAAVLEMSTKRWSCPAWEDLEFEASMEVGSKAGGGGGFNFPMLYTPQRDVAMNRGVTACIAPPPASAPPGTAKKPGASSYALGQDKTRISALFSRPAPRPDPPNVLAAKAPAGAPASKQPRSAPPKAGGTSKPAAKKARAGKRKARSDSESEGEDDVEEEPPSEEEEAAEELPLTYPREVCFKPGDIPLAEYKGKDDSDAEFEVEAIVDEVVDNRKKYVLVKWKGYELDTEDWSEVGDVKHLDIYKDWVKARKAAGKK